MTVDNTIIETRKLRKEFVRGECHMLALDDVDLEIGDREFVALMGPSGSGKSTLLHLIAAMDRATSGSVIVMGEDLGCFDSRQVGRWRSDHIGFVFQRFNLIPVLTAIENVELPLTRTHLSKRERIEHARAALNMVGLADRASHFPRQLSGGQEQRVAIARAIVTDPTIILADEPTGNLDAAAAGEILTLLARLNSDSEKTIVMVTHDLRASKFASKIRYLEKGQLLAEETYVIPISANS